MFNFYQKIIVKKNSSSSNAIVLTWWVHGNEHIWVQILELFANKINFGDFNSNIYILPKINEYWFDKKTRWNENKVDINRNFPLENHGSSFISWWQSISHLLPFYKWISLQEETKQYIKFFEEYIFPKYDNILLIDVHSAPFLKWPNIWLPRLFDLWWKITLQHQIVNDYRWNIIDIDRGIFAKWWIVSKYYQDYVKNYKTNFPTSNVIFVDQPYSISGDNIDYLQAKHYMDFDKHGNNKSFLWLCLEVWCAEWLCENSLWYIRKKIAWEKTKLWYEVTNPPNSKTDLVKSEYISYLYNLIETREKAR